MDTKSRQATQLLEALSFVSTLRDTTGGLKVVAALLESSRKEWANSVDANSGEHLIKGVFQSTGKGDAIRIYISKIVVEYMASVGVRITSWTKNTIASDNFTNTATASKISATEFKTHEELFRMVATRLLGFDTDLISIAVAETPAEKAKYLVAYLGSRYDLGDNRDELVVNYQNAVDLFEKKFEAESFDNDYFLKTTGQLIAYYSQPDNGLALLENLFDVLDMLDGDGNFDALGVAAPILGTGIAEIIIDKDDADPVGTMNYLRSVFGESVRIIMPTNHQARPAEQAFNAGSVPEALLQESQVEQQGEEIRSFIEEARNEGLEASLAEVRQGKEPAEPPYGDAYKTAPEQAATTEEPKGE